MERILARHPDVVLAAVYAVPDPVVGDRVMAAVELRPGVCPDIEALGAFVRSQPDLGTKWTPTFVRVMQELPLTPSNKVMKRLLRRERWDCSDPVWWIPARDQDYRRFTAGDAADLRTQFAARGRLAALDAV